MQPCRDFVSLAGEKMYVPDCSGTLPAHRFVCPTDQAFTCSQIPIPNFQGLCPVCVGFCGFGQLGQHLLCQLHHAMLSGHP